MTPVKVEPTCSLLLSFSFLPPLASTTETLASIPRSYLCLVQVSMPSPCGRPVHRQPLWTNYGYNSVASGGFSTSHPIDLTWMITYTLFLKIMQINPSLWTINIKTFVTIVLEKVHDFLLWKLTSSPSSLCIGFKAFAFLDGSIVHYL